MEMNVDKNEIEERCLPLASLNEMSTEWIAKVMFLSVSKGPKPGEPHVLLFADSEKTIMQAVMFSRDYKSMGSRLKPMQTVYLGNSKIALIENSKHQYGNVPYQIHMNMKTLFEPVDEGASHELSDCVDITPFWEIDAHQEKEDDLYNILGSIVHMLSPRTVNSQGGLTKVQEFVLLNQECRPMILTFWGSYSAPELSEMINLMHTRPVVLLVSLILGTFNGTCVEAHNHTKIILNPPLSQTNPLITWVTEHNDYVHHVISNELYKKENQEVRKPSEDNVWQIHQVLNLQKPTKNCWVKATISIVELSQSVSKSLCSRCGNSSGALPGMKFTCNYCGQFGRIPKLSFKIGVRLSDTSGDIDVIVQDQCAQKLLGIPEKILCNKKIDLTASNKKLQDRIVYCHLKSFKKSKDTIGIEMTAFLDDKTGQESNNKPELESQSTEDGGTNPESMDSCNVSLEDSAVDLVYKKRKTTHESGPSVKKTMY